MVNICAMIITKGVNKGKLCKEVNRWCKHKKMYCNQCKRVFSYQHSYNAHVCIRQEHPEPIHLPSPAKVPVHIYVKPSASKNKPIQSPRSSSSASASASKSETQELKEMVYQLRDEIDEIRKQPKVQIQNLTVVTDDIFGKIITQMGEREGVKFLLESMNNDGECLSIVDKVYLSGKDRDQYPIACKNNNHFRFLGPNHNIVDDVGGDLIVTKITNSVQDAFLRASADDETVYNRIRHLPSADQRERLKEGLATKVSNPTHPFFQLEE